MDERRILPWLVYLSELLGMAVLLLAGLSLAAWGSMDRSVAFGAAIPWPWSRGCLTSTATATGCFAG